MIWVTVVTFPFQLGGKRLRAVERIIRSATSIGENSREITITGEPDRDLDARRIRRDREEEIRAHEHELVGDRIEVGPERRAHVEPARKEPIHAVREPRDDEDRDGDAEVAVRDRDEEERQRREAQQRDEVRKRPRSLQCSVPPDGAVAFSPRADRARTRSRARVNAAPLIEGPSSAGTIRQARAARIASPPWRAAAVRPSRQAGAGAGARSTSRRRYAAAAAASERGASRFARCVSRSTSRRPSEKTRAISVPFGRPTASLAMTPSVTLAVRTSGISTTGGAPPPRASAGRAGGPRTARRPASSRRETRGARRPPRRRTWGLSPQACREPGRRLRSLRARRGPRRPSSRATRPPARDPTRAGSRPAPWRAARSPVRCCARRLLCASAERGSMAIA